MKCTKEFECDCGHKGYLMVCDLGDGLIEFNFRTDRRKTWEGAILNKEDMNELRRFLEPETVANPSRG